MEYIGDAEATPQHFILCCECGTQIEPNPANMCVACLRAKVDITEGIPKTGTLHFCKACERYYQPPAAWISAQLESRELLSLCLKRIKGLNKVRLVDASFVWTEPHSKRVKVKLSIQKEVNNGAVLQQVFIVEFTVHSQMCDDCHRVEAKDFWRACVQIRQKVFHKKTLFYLEQLILKHKAHVNSTNIKSVTDGIDFFYAQKQDSKRLVDFLQQVVPCRVGTAQELISHDIHNNTYNYKHTYCVEIVPVCKDNVVCLPPKLAQQLGNMGQLCLCTKVAQSVHLIDPTTCQIAEIHSTTFWRYPFQAIFHAKQLQEYIVMQMEITLDSEKKHVAGAGHISQKHVLGEVWVVKASEIGTSEQQYHCRTHLVHLLNIGDSVLGYDLRTANINDPYFEKMRQERIPDVIIIKKFYGESQRRQQKRKWKLKHMETMETETASKDYQEFLEELEEDAEFRQHINIYKDDKRQTSMPVEVDESDDEGLPQITLQEMLDDLKISEDATGGEGDDMMT